MRFLREETAAALFAWQMLTRVPIPASIEFNRARQRRAIGYYPLAGALIGICIAAFWFAAQWLLPSPVAILLAIAAGLLLTGAFHEDGLADTADGLGGRDAAAALAIMVDSRIGVFGAAALWLVLAIKAAALIALPAAVLPMALLFAHAGSRLSLVIVMATSPYVGANPEAKPTTAGVGAGGLIRSALTGFAVLAAALTVVPALVLAGGLIGLIIGHAAGRLLYERKLRGHTGDCLGATQQLSELGVYLGLLVAL